MEIVSANNGFSSHNGYCGLAFVLVLEVVAGEPRTCYCFQLFLSIPDVFRKGVRNMFFVIWPNTNQIKVTETAFSHYVIMLGDIKIKPYRDSIYVVKLFCTCFSLLFTEQVFALLAEDAERESVPQRSRHRDD